MKTRHSTSSAWLRTKMELSPREFALLLGVSAATVSRWERGTLKVSPPHERLLGVLALRLDWWQHDDGWRRTLRDGRGFDAFQQVAAAGL